MKFIAVLGRQPKISIAELTALFSDVKQVSSEIAIIETTERPEIKRLGGTLKLAEKMAVSPLKYLSDLEGGKITLGISDYSKNSSARKSQNEALKLKKILVRHGKSVRVLQNKTAALSTATSHHNQLGEKKNHEELILIGNEWFRVFGVQNITAYAKRDQARPARDAKVGMLPPKLAQILINLCGDLEKGGRILDPFCGTGVVLQEALLDSYIPYGTDLSERMVEYSEKNLKWLKKDGDFKLEVGDAMNFRWSEKIDAVACEGYLGKPMSTPPVEIKLKTEKQECKTIIVGFLKNLADQVKEGTPVVMAIPAWLRPDGEYSRLNILDEVENLGYNVVKFKGVQQKDLLYHREGQVVAREIIVLRKK